MGTMPVLLPVAVAASIVGAIIAGALVAIVRVLSWLELDADAAIPEE